MTERLYYNDSYLKTFEAQIVSASADGLRLVLDQTAFYPPSGGQPADRGTLNGVTVEAVAEDGEAIVHLMAEAIQAERVSGTIDWARRKDHMEQHTGQHLLSAVLERDFGLRTESFHMGADYSTIDLAAPAIAAEVLLEAEIRANTVLRENLPVRVSYEDAHLAAGLRKESQREGTLRIVEIFGLDRSACGGTHVAFTGEIGSIRLGKTEKIRQSTRLYFYCGGRALEFNRKQLQDLRDSEQALRERLVEAEKRLGRFSMELAQRRGADRYAGGQVRWVDSVALISEELRWEAHEFVKGAGAVVLLYSPENGGLLLGAQSGLDIAEAFRRAGVKGGGKGPILQGKHQPGLSLEQVAEQLLGA